MVSLTPIEIEEVIAMFGVGVIKEVRDSITDDERVTFWLSGNDLVVIRGDIVGTVEGGRQHE